MKINYDEIITKANARKDALQALVPLLEALPAHLAAVEAASNALYAAHTAYNALDAEGRSLLGDVGSPLYNVTNDVGNAVRAEGYNSSVRKFNMLRAAIAKLEG